MPPGAHDLVLEISRGFRHSRLTARLRNGHGRSMCELSARVLAFGDGFNNSIL